MEKTVNIEGVMCPGCSGIVKSALEDISGVDCADISRDRKKAVVRISGRVDDLAIRSAVENAGYGVSSIQ